MQRSESRFTFVQAPTGGGTGVCRSCRVVFVREDSSVLFSSLCLTLVCVVQFLAAPDLLGWAFSACFRSFSLLFSLPGYSYLRDASVSNGRMCISIMLSSVFSVCS